MLISQVVSVVYLAGLALLPKQLRNEKAVRLGSEGSSPGMSQVNVGKP